jgi:hypothetical protein
VAGFPARAQLVQRYARLSGRDVSNLPYWVAFSRWRSACIGVGVRARYLAGHMGDDGFAASFLPSAESGEPGSAGSRAVLVEASIRHNETTGIIAAFPATAADRA